MVVVAVRGGEGSLHMWLEEGGRDKRSLHRVVVEAVGGGGGLPAHVAGGGGREEGTGGLCRVVVVAIRGGRDRGPPAQWLLL